MECRCTSVTELYGSEAEEYAAEHLRREETDSGPLADRFACPDTGRRWELDYPEATEEEPGQARLRVVA